MPSAIEMAELAGTVDLMDELNTSYAFGEAVYMDQVASA